MFGITDLPTYLLGTLLIVLLPGPNSLYVMSIASRYGIRTGYIGALGIFTGDLILMLCTAFGAASLLHAFPWIFILLKAIGALYLSYLGLKLLLAGLHTWRTPSEQQTILSTEAVKDIHPYRTALTISLLNPKAILFFLSFFVQFVDPDYAYPALSFMVLAVFLQIISLGYLTALIFSGVKLADFFRTKYRLAASGIFSVGLLFCAFGIKLATSTIS